MAAKTKKKAAGAPRKASRKKTAGKSAAAGSRKAGAGAAAPKAPVKKAAKKAAPEAGKKAQGRPRRKSTYDYAPENYAPRLRQEHDSERAREPVRHRDMPYPGRDADESRDVGRYAAHSQIRYGDDDGDYDYEGGDRDAAGYDDRAYQAQSGYSAGGDYEEARSGRGHYRDKRSYRSARGRYAGSGEDYDRERDDRFYGRAPVHGSGDWRRDRRDERAFGREEESRDCGFEGREQPRYSSRADMRGGGRYREDEYYEEIPQPPRSHDPRREPMNRPAWVREKRD
jgi:hypothetical protein